MERVEGGWFKVMVRETFFVAAVFFLLAGFSGLATAQLGEAEGVPEFVAEPVPESTATPAPCYAVFNFKNVYNKGQGNAERVASVGLSPLITEEGPAPLLTVSENEFLPLDSVDGGWVPTAPDLIVKRGENNLSVMLYGYYFSGADYERSVGTVTIVNGVVTGIINPAKDPLDNQGNSRCRAMAGSYRDDEANYTGNVVSFCMGVRPGADSFTILYVCNPGESEATPVPFGEFDYLTKGEGGEEYCDLFCELGKIFEGFRSLFK